MAKVIVLIRHAHRDTLDKDQDNGLSKKGQEQLQERLKEMRQRTLPKGDVFLTSPKKRCQETVSPLADFCNKKFIVEQALNEQQPHESHNDMIKRLEVFVKKIDSIEGTVYLCSHGDVLPELMDVLTGTYIDLKKAQALVLTPTQKKWELK